MKGMTGCVCGLKDEARGTGKNEALSYLYCILPSCKVGLKKDGTFSEITHQPILQDGQKAV